MTHYTCSDNGTNFVGAVNDFNNINLNEISKYSSVQRITWKFNPPSAAWWGVVKAPNKVN